MHSKVVKGTKSWREEIAESVRKSPSVCCQEAKSNVKVVEGERGGAPRSALVPGKGCRGPGSGLPGQHGEHALAGRRL